MSASRKAARQALGALLSAAATSAQAVYRYQKGDWKGISPIVAITSAGSERQRMTMQGSRAVFSFDVHVFVLYKATGWTEEQAEDALDDIEQQVCTAVDANPRTAHWASIAYADATQARDTVIIGGATYLHEVIPLQVSVHT